MTERIASRCVCCGSQDLDRSAAVLMPFVANRAFGWTPVEITADWGLRTLRTGMAYPLCNSLQCRDCGLLFLDIRFSEAEMAALYSGYREQAYAAQRDRFEPGYAVLNDSILATVFDTSPAEAFLAPHVAPSPRVLDWGGGNGANTPFRATAARVDIFDISERPLVGGAQRVERAELQGVGYDLVVMSHVLEHVPNPADLVNEAAGAMGDATMLYIEVPYEDLVAEASGARNLASRKKYWHEHVNFFTEEAMRRLTARCGLEIVDLQIRSMPSLANIHQALAAVCRLAPRANVADPRGGASYAKA